MEIPQNTHNLAKKDGYFARFDEIKDLFLSQKEAYEHLENEVKATHKRKRYSSYDSFRNQKAKRTTKQP